MAIIVVSKENKDEIIIRQVGKLSKDLIDFMRQFDYYPETSVEQQVRFLSSLLENGGRIYVFLDSKRVVGFASVCKEKKHDNFLIESIFVVPEKRGCGIGKSLVLRILSDYPDVFLNVGTSVVNKSAIGFYKHLGFVENRVYFQKKPESLKGVR